MVTLAVTVADLWREYETRILPKDCHPIQRQETRRAFYCGGAALLGGILAMMSDGHEATDDDLAAMNALQAEFDAFAKDIAEGRA